MADRTIRVKDIGAAALISGRHGAGRRDGRRRGGVMPACRRKTAQHAGERKKRRTFGYDASTMAARVDFGLLKETFAAWNADKAPRLAAAIAYSTVFAIAPLLIITIAIVGVIMGFTGTAHPHSDVENALLNQIRHAAGSDAAVMVRGMVDASFGKPRANVVAQILGWVTFVIGASGLFVALQDSLNTVWGAKAPPSHQNILIMLRDRAATLGMLLVIAFLMATSSLLSVAISLVSSNFEHALPFANAGIVFAAINWIVSVIVIAVLFGLIFKVLPTSTSHGATCASVPSQRRCCSWSGKR